MAAYNLPADQSALENEYQRQGYTLYTGHGLDIQFEDIRLEDACEREGITLSGNGSMARDEADSEMLRLQAAKGLQSLAEAETAR